MTVRVVAHTKRFNRYGTLVTYQSTEHPDWCMRKVWCCDEDLPRLGSLWRVDSARRVKT